MAKTEQPKTFRWQAHKPLLAATLATAGVFNMVSAVLAEGTAANTPISNTATATYNDGNANTFNATSNTVVIKVAEIAGLIAVARPVLDGDGGAIEAGDDLTFIFDVTNVGNAPTNVFVPNIDNLVTFKFTPSTFDSTATNPETTAPVAVYDANGLFIGRVVSDGAGGSKLVDNNGNDVLPPVIGPDESFIVKVTGRPAAGTAAGDTISVRLGDTTNNPDEGPDPTQNQPDDSDTGALNNDLRTVDPTPGDPADDPENGEREAEATASGIFASSVQPLALATVLKTGSITSTGAPTSLADDLITYDLGLRVESTSPSDLFQAAALEGTNINLSIGNAAAAPTKRILVSDAIPVGTKLSSVSTALPTGWRAVYTTSASNNLLDNSITWTTVAPADLNTVTRVGFIFNGTIGATGTTLTGLKFTVVSSGVTSTNNTIRNIAQVFGETVGDPARTDNNPATIPQIIYDESGDANPNNFNDNNSPPVADGSDYDPATDTGIANDPDADEVDTFGNNTGTGPDGELNVITIAPTDDILNGTQGRPDAIGPTDDNDDFTNKSTPTPPVGTAPTAPFDPAEVVFNNSLKNPAASGFIAQTTVEPLSPTQAQTASGKITGYGANTDIPNGTKVTIVGNGKTAVYLYDQAAGVFNLDPATTRVNFGNVVAGQTVDYTVAVDLPAGTAQLKGVSIPIVAFPDDNLTTSPGYTGETTNNVTIDRLYTGFMSLLKEARVLNASGAPKGGSVFSNDPTLNAAPGEFIEYRITYQNISQALTGPGSVPLTARDFVILEDGLATVGNPNNWATFTTHQQNTTASSGKRYFYATSAAPTRANATSATEADPASGTVIEKYENYVPSVAPQATGTFSFRRVVD